MRRKVFFLITTTMVMFGVFTTFAQPATFVQTNPVVKVEQGYLMGFINDKIYTFLGVPYANAKRFEMPQKPTSWEGIRKAQTYGEIAPIPDQTTVGYDEFVWPHRYWPQNENCQFLNIWTPSINYSAKKPVLVFFHGGGYTNGSSIEAVAYDGKNLSAFGDVVVITLNHRLNALGFLDLSAYGEKYKNTPNLGIADLIAALQWIHDNITQFGGDPNNVTIFGQSGGGGKVEAVMHAPSAKGLFSRAAILSSGGAMLSSRPQIYTRKIAELTLAELGLNGSTVDKILEVSYRQLIDAANKAIAKAQALDPKGNYNWGPVADGSFLSMDYCDYTKDMPLIVGCVFSESTNNTLKVGDGRKNQWTPAEVKANLTARFGVDADDVLTEFKKLFPYKIDADAFFYATGRNRVISVRDAKLASGNGPVYTYLFSYEAPVNGGITAFHCADLIYIFHNVDIPILRIATGGTNDAFRLQDIMSTAFVNFARTGNPSQPGLEWPAYTSSGKENMIFDAKSYAGSFDDARLLKFMGNR